MKKYTLPKCEFVLLIDENLIMTSTEILSDPFKPDIEW